MLLVRPSDPFFNYAPAPPETYTLSLHDALPISPRCPTAPATCLRAGRATRRAHRPTGRTAAVAARTARSEEHTSELQSRFDLVCRLLLEKKKKAGCNSTCTN